MSFELRSSKVQGPRGGDESIMEVGKTFDEAKAQTDNEYQVLTAGAQGDLDRVILVCPILYIYYH